MNTSVNNVKEKENEQYYTNIDWRDANDLQDDYEFIIHCIQDDEIAEMLNLIGSSDMKYFLIVNDLVYNIFRACIIFKRFDGIYELIRAGYKFNKDTLLIELYDCLNYKKNVDKTKDSKPDNLLTEDDMNFIISFNDGELINTDKCIVEFYFLLLCNEFELATNLLIQDYAAHLRDYFNQIFIGDESHLLKHILVNPEIVKLCVKYSLFRKLDGIAL